MAEREEKTAEERKNEERIEDIITPEMQKKFAESICNMIKKQEECGKKGHPNAEVTSLEYMPRQRAYMSCPDCNAHYNRQLNQKERKEMDRSLHEPMTI